MRKMPSVNVTPTIAALIAAGLFILDSGCTSESPHKPPAKSASPVRESPSASTLDDTGERTFETSEARDLDNAVENVRTLDGGKYSDLLAVLADGSFVAQKASVSPDGTLISNPHLYLVDSEGAAEEIPRRGGARPTQIVNAAANDEVVMWQETPSTELTNLPWRMYVHDRRTRRTSLVAASKGSYGRPARPVPGFTGPVLSGREVHWAQSAWSGAEERVDILGCLSTACTPQVELANAAFPVVTSGGLLGLPVAVKNGYARPDPTRTILGAAAARVCPMIRTRQVTALAAEGKVCAVVERVKGVDRVLIRNRAGRLAMQGRPGENLAYPIVTKRFVAVAESSGASPDNLGGYLLDLKKKTLYRLGNFSGLYGISGAGEYISWQERHGADNVTYVGKLKP